MDRSNGQRQLAVVRRGRIALARGVTPLSRTALRGGSGTGLGFSGWAPFASSYPVQPGEGEVSKNADRL